MNEIRSLDGHCLFLSTDDNNEIRQCYRGGEIARHYRRSTCLGQSSCRSCQSERQRSMSTRLKFYRYLAKTASDIYEIIPIRVFYKLCCLTDNTRPLNGIQSCPLLADHDDKSSNKLCRPKEFSC